MGCFGAIFGLCLRSCVDFDLWFWRECGIVRLLLAHFSLVGGYVWCCFAGFLIFVGFVVGFGLLL